MKYAIEKIARALIIKLSRFFLYSGELLSFTLKIISLLIRKLFVFFMRTLVEKIRKQTIIKYEIVKNDGDITNVIISINLRTLMSVTANRKPPKNMIIVVMS